MDFIRLTVYLQSMVNGISNFFDHYCSMENDYMSVDFIQFITMSLHTRFSNNSEDNNRYFRYLQIPEDTRFSNNSEDPKMLQQVQSNVSSLLGMVTSSHH